MKTKIAIVEDLKQDSEILAQKINSYMNERNFVYELFFFENGEDFIGALKTKQFDIVFMDIFMSGINGMETATVLRKKDSDCKLVFLTCTDGYLRQGYSKNASHYLIKPIQDEEFTQAMENCHIRAQYDVPTLNVTYKNESFPVDTAKIIYIDYYNRNVQIHFEDSVLSVSGKFRDITDVLNDDKRFLLCIKGIMVNMDYISKFEDSVFILKNEERLQIRLRNKKHIIQQYMTYKFRKMGSEV